MEDRENKNYINAKIHPIFEKLIIDLLLVKPEEPVDYIITWLKEKGQQFKKPAMSHIHEQTMPLSGQINIQKAKKPIIEDKPSSEEDEDDVCEELPKAKLQKIQNSAQRASVSAEAFGQFNQKKNFKPRVIPKKHDQRDRIIKRIQNAFMFACLEDRERDIVIDAMEEKKFQPGDWVIKQGEDGSEVYIIDQGELDCFKKFSPKEEQRYVKTYNPGESFGELALLYNAPRAASIRAKIECTLWALDRDTFNNIVKDSTMKKREKYEQFITNIEILKSMDPYEKTKVCDALKACKFKKGDYVVQQGEEGDSFYMVEEGELVALKIQQPGNDPEEVFNYKPGMYFGELALLKNQPRQTSIICKTDCSLLLLDRYSFKRLLGPIEDILVRNTAMYNKYCKQQ